MKFELKKTRLYTLILFNLIAFFYILINSMIRVTNLATEIFMLISFLTFIADMVYAAFTKNRWGLYANAGIMLLLFVDFGSVQLSSLPAFINSLPVVGIIALLFIPIAGIATAIPEALGIPDNFKINAKFDNVFRRVLAVFIPFAFLFTAFCGYNAILGGGGYLKYFTDFAQMYLLVVSINLFLTFVRLYRDSKKKLRDMTAALVIAMFLITFVSFAFRESLVVGYNITKTDAVKTGGLRRYPYSFTDSFLGVETKGIAVEKDVVYYVSDKNGDRGLALKYDMYYPVFDGAVKSVIVNIHGRGADKGFMNMSGRSKYFASLGYVVYDIQVGDYSESGTNYTAGVVSDSAYMLPHISEFFKYAVAHNEAGANFSSAFVMGVSMGGSLTLKFAISYENGLEELGVDIKGIMPCYPGYWPNEENDWDDYAGKIDADTVPCLLSMGRQDEIVIPDAIDIIGELYDGAGNQGFEGVGFQFAGHACDFNFTGPENQVIIYRMERFMLKYR
jgi:hypothetical protein